MCKGVKNIYVYGIFNDFVLSASVLARESDDSSQTNSFLEFWIINLRFGAGILWLGI